MTLTLAPLFQESSGKLFIVADKKLLFTDVFSAVLSIDSALSHYHWSDVRWTNILVDLKVKDIDTNFENWFYKEVPVMVMTNG